jgi:hypothetical protein
MKHLGCALAFLVVLGWANLVQAVIVTDGGIGSLWPQGIEASQTLDTVVATSGTFADAVYSQVVLGAFGAADSGLDTTHALGYMAQTQGFVTGSYGANYGIALGSANSSLAPIGARGSLTLGLANKVLTNVAGNDIVVSESGSAGAPEGYMVRVSTDGTNFTSWQFRQAQVLYTNASPVTPGSTPAEFLTGFDFVNDFGLAPTATVKLVEVQNCIATDKVNSATGQGTVVFVGDAGYSSASTILAGSLSADSGGTFSASHFDADPCYVFYGGSAAVPEPGSLMLVAIGGLSALVALAIKRRRVA